MLGLDLNDRMAFDYACYLEGWMLFDADSIREEIQRVDDPGSWDWRSIKDPQIYYAPKFESDEEARRFVYDNPSPLHERAITLIIKSRMTR